MRSLKTGATDDCEACGHWKPIPGPLKSNKYPELLSHLSSPKVCSSFVHSINVRLLQSLIDRGMGTWPWTGIQNKEDARNRGADAGYLVVCSVCLFLTLIL